MVSVMTTESFISKKIIECLDKEIQQSLADNQIRAIGNYGWLDEDTPDPEFMGHAMWQTEPPLRFDGGFFFEKDQTQSQATDYQKTLTVAGADFEGLMELARIAIGLTLSHENLAKDAIFSDNHHFWLNHVNAMLLHAMASDRLRDFFVMAYYKMSAKEYAASRKKKKGGQYTTPFKEANDDSEYQKIKPLLMKLLPLAGRIFNCRENRNAIVHEVATKIGTINRELMHARSNCVDEICTLNFPKQNPDAQELKMFQHRAEESHKRELREAAEQIVSWYKTLAQASSYVFEIENRLRRS